MSAINDNFLQEIANIPHYCENTNSVVTYCNDCVLNNGELAAVYYPANYAPVNVVLNGEGKQEQKMLRSNKNASLFQVNCYSNLPGASFFSTNLTFLFRMLLRCKNSFQGTKTIMLTKNRFPNTPMRVYCRLMLRNTLLFPHSR